MLGNLALLHANGVDLRPRWVSGLAEPDLLRSSRVKATRPSRARNSDIA